jgi:hypothetical protein
MSRRLVVVVSLLWAASLVSVGLWAQGRQGEKPEGLEIRPRQAFGAVISGEDIGFQPVAGPSSRPGTITGRLVVRVNGEWLEVTFPVRAVPAR